MNERPTGSQRTDSRASVAVLAGGTAIAVVIFVASFALRLAGLVAAADTVAAVAVLELLAIPAAALCATAIEQRRADRPVWVLAIVVLLILGGATILALFSR